MGIELWGPVIAVPIVTRLRLVAIFGADFKTFEELHWVINSNLVGGVEWSKAGADRRVRLLVNYCHGFTPYGQFFAQKMETVGAGLYLSCCSAMLTNHISVELHISAPVKRTRLAMTHAKQQYTYGSKVMINDPNMAM